MKVSNSTIQFRIDIDFDEADVDVVYQEARQGGYTGTVPTILIEPHTHTVKGNKTPTAGTVDFALSWLSGFVDSKQMCTSNQRECDFKNGIAPYYHKLTELEKLGVTVTETYGLMMGTCHLICEVDTTQHNIELMNKANTIVFETFKRFVKYYKAGKKMRA